MCSVLIYAYTCAQYMCAYMRTRTSIYAAHIMCTCPYASFKLTNPLYGEWATGQYMTALNDQFYFGTNDSSKAQIYTLDISNGRLFRDANSFAFWQGTLQGHDAQVRSQSPAFIATQQQANYITCQVPREAASDPLNRTK